MALRYFADRKNVYLFPWYIADVTISDDISALLGKAMRESFMVIDKGFVTAYYDFDSADELCKTACNKIISDPEYFPLVIKKIYEYSAALDKSSIAISALDASILSSSELIDIYEKYVKDLRQLRVWGWIPPLVDGITDSYLSNHIQKVFTEHAKTQGKEARALEYYTILSSSDKQSEVQQEEIARLAVLRSFEEHGWLPALKDIAEGNFSNFEARHPEAFLRIQQHLKEYGWLTYSYVGPLMSLQHFFALVSDNMKRGGIREQQQSKQEYYANLKKEKERILIDLKVPLEIQRLFEISAECMFIKDYRKGVYQRSYVAMDNILTEIGTRLDMTLKQVKFLLFEECKEALLEEEKEEYRSIAQSREKLCCYHIKDGMLSIFQGEECRAVIEEFVSEPVKDEGEVSELKGTIAYKGEVRGIAKIVLTVEDIAKVNEGDILISSATNPDLILAMKRAAAFVTDMGGIISHASIVAREMKKPCLVGTKTATHVFKDGDMVFVDANNGFIKKII